MWPESKEHQQPLRTGLTTGACATACTVAAAQALLHDRHPTSVSITLPKGKTVELTMELCTRNGQVAKASTIKDAGDDPDATHGATVFVELMLTKKPGVTFFAGKGVGIVTKAGLSLEIGEPAINPVPRQMMSEHLTDIATHAGHQGGFEVTVGIENGEAIALKTMNPRLGIIGGLSVLGTTGIVRPFSCAAWIASIYQGIDVARANGVMHLAATTGSSSEQAIQQHYDLTDTALIEMGDFAGSVLKYLRKAPVEKLSVCGGFGKISKLADGHLDLNSRVSAINFEHIAQVARDQGADDELLNKILVANTSIEALQLCSKANLDLAGGMCQAAHRYARGIVPETVALEVWAIDRTGAFVGCATDETPTGKPCSFANKSMGH